MTEEPAAINNIGPQKKLPVMEIFGPTVQGEGLVIGQRTLFVRFGLCDYACKMCDSMHAVDPKSVSKNATWMTQAEILEKVQEMLKDGNCSWVTLSGGNPCIHDLTWLTNHMDSYGIGVSVETQGTFAPDWLTYCDYVTCSPKGPGMGEKFEAAKFLAFINKFKGHPGLSVKVVIFDARDLEFASMIAEMCPLLVNTDRFYLSLGNPNPPPLDPSSTPPAQPFVKYRDASIRLYKDMLEELRLWPVLRTVRFLPQMHYWLWGDEKSR